MVKTINLPDTAGKLEYWIGLDVGQAADPSAVAVLKRVLEPAGEPFETRAYVNTANGASPRPVIRQPVRCVYHASHLDRPPLRTPLPNIAGGVVSRIRRLAPTNPVYEARHTVGLIVDGTGVGRGVVDDIYKRLREELDPKRDPKVKLYPANITGGTQAHRDAYGWWNIPKKELIFTTVALLQDGRIKWSKLIPERKVLEKELLNYRLNVNINTGHMSFEPWREGEHDDLLFALCLAAWSWEKSKIVHVDTPVLAAGVGA